MLLRFSIHIMFMSRSLKTEALSILLLRLIMYIMRMSRSLKTTERETYYITAI